MISKRWSIRPNKWILKIINKWIFLTVFGGNLFVLFLPYHHQAKKSPDLISGLCFCSINIFAIMVYMPYYLDEKRCYKHACKSA